MRIGIKKMLEEHQKEVVFEKAQLDERIRRMEALLNGEGVRPSVTECEKTRMYNQYRIMVKYSNILNERIIHF